MGRVGLAPALPQLLGLLHNPRHEHKAVWGQSQWLRVPQPLLQGRLLLADVLDRGLLGGPQDEKLLLRKEEESSARKLWKMPNKTFRSVAMKKMY